jgi:hypothetical protein
MFQTVPSAIGGIVRVLLAAALVYCVFWFVDLTLYLMGWLGLAWVIALPTSLIMFFRKPAAVQQFGQILLLVAIGMTPGCLFLALYNGWNAIDPSASSSLVPIIRLYDFAIVEIYDYSEPMEKIPRFFWVIIIVSVAAVSWRLHKPSFFDRVMRVKDAILALVLLLSSLPLSACPRAPLLQLGISISRQGWRPKSSKRLSTQRPLTSRT